MQSFYELTAPDAVTRRQILKLVALDPDFARIEAMAGPLTLLVLPPTFSALVRIIVGQQLSTQSAKVIYFRLLDSIVLEPAPFLKVPDNRLKEVGLSRAKIETCRSVAYSILDDTLNLDACQAMEAAEVLSRFTAIKGIGPWTAELFLLFALRHPDTFPAGDLALQRGYQMLKGREEALSRIQLIQSIQVIRPYRSMAAHLLWHYYRFLTKFPPT